MLYLQVSGGGTSCLTLKELFSQQRSLTHILICHLLQPLSWQQPYVPVLARGMLDFLMAPTAFLMGCHISHFEEVAAVSTTQFLFKLRTLFLINIKNYNLGFPVLGRVMSVNLTFLPQDDGSNVGCFGFLA